MFPPIPEWDALHPLVVHFPIGLLMSAPVLILLGAVVPKAGRYFRFAALVIMLLGATAAWVAVSTGEAASTLTDQSPPVGPVLDKHEELAEYSAWAFSILTGVYAVIAIVPALLKKPVKGWITTAVSIVFLCVYLGFTTLLAHTAHKGGLLVHEYGVHAFLPLGEE